MSNPGSIPSPGGRLAAIVLFLPAARLLFHLINNPDIHPDAALAIGLPAVGAFFLALLTPAPRSATGRLLKGTALLVLIAWGLFSLNGLMVLSISPLLFSTSLIIGLAVDTRHRTAGPLISDHARDPNPSRAAGSGEGKN
jgi:hypothetical protein